MIAAALAIVAASEAQAGPVIFVDAQPNAAWWSSDLKFRPTSTAIGRVTIADINANLEKRRGMGKAAKVCFADAVTPGSIVSSAREVQKDIDDTLEEYPGSFQAVLSSPGGPQFRVQVVAYESCAPEPVGGTALLITKVDGTLHTFDVQEFVFTRLFKRDDGVINVFGCYSCGDLSELLYDQGNDRFHYNWIGH